jgi:hypothetical protein
MAVKDSVSNWLVSWCRQLVLQRTPQDDPWSPAALAAALLAYALVDLLQATLTAASRQAALGMALLDIFLLVLFAGLVLQIAGKRVRLVQTVTALAGTGSLLGVVSLPLLQQAVRAPQADGPGGALVLAWLMLLAWNLAVQAHIFRHALSTRYGIGVLLAGVHTVLAIALLETVFPRVGNGNGIQ